MDVCASPLIAPILPDPGSPALADLTDPGARPDLADRTILSVVEPGPLVPTARIEVLGGFRFTVAGREVRVAEVAEQLLAILAVKGRPLRRGEAAGSFWPEASERQALGNLRSMLWRMVGASHGVLDVQPRWIGLQPWVSYDLAEGSGLARRLIDPNVAVEGDQLRLARVALDRDLLPGWYADWVGHEAERWRQLRLHALEALSARLVASGQVLAGLEAALVCVEAEPLRESAHAAVIRAHLAEHNRSESIRAYETYRGLLMRELGLAPSDHLRALAQLPATVGPAGRRRG